MNQIRAAGGNHAERAASRAVCRTGHYEGPLNHRIVESSNPTTRLTTDISGHPEPAWNVTKIVTEMA